MHEEIFSQVDEISEVAKNIMEKRYLHDGETTWEDITKRVMENLFNYWSDPEQYEFIYQMLKNRYFIPNSPTLVNAGKKGGGLSGCYVVDFPDSIEGIYKTKLDFALIAKKGGGCGTTLSKLRPEGAIVNGSTHGYAGGPVKFFDTICYDMTVMTQAGFRDMAMMGVMSVYHPDIIRFITAKTEEGRMRTTNISVLVDDAFMQRVENDEMYWTVFEGIQYKEYKARDIFNLIVDGAWRNGEPGILFYNRINDSPYKYSGQEILATNPCGEQPLPPNGVCNLGSLDISKFTMEYNGSTVLDLNLLALAVKLSVRFLDAVIDNNSYPTPEIEKWVLDNRPIGLGIMGLADLFLTLGITYGDEASLENTEFILRFIYTVAEEESIYLGQEKGIPLQCMKLPIPRRNITLLSIAPTGSLSLLANCSSGIEPIFSEITERKDKTGEYLLKHPKMDLAHFRVAVSSNGAKEVTWKEHIDLQNATSRFVDSGVSKTINFPNHVHRDTVYDAFMYAWKSPFIKGLTIYRNGSRKMEVLSPKNLKKDKCPLCGNDLISEGGCRHCSVCDFSLCEIG